MNALILGLLRPAFGPCHHFVVVETDEFLDPAMRDAQRLAYLFLREDVSLHASDTAPDAAIQKLGQGWIAEEALAIGVYCALKARDFETGIIMAVNRRLLTERYPTA